MNERDTTRLTDEIRSLRTQLLWMRRAGFLALLLIGSTFLLGQAARKAPPALTASLLTIVDDKGNAVIELGTTDRGPYMVFKKDGRQILNCRVSKKGYPFFALVDTSGKSVATLQTGMADQPGAFLFLENKTTGRRQQLSTERGAGRR